MIKKHIAHLATESLKFFFNVDHSICHHWMVTMAVLFGIARIFMGSIINIFHDGVLTVQYDMYLLKTEFAGLKERIEKSGEYQNFMKNINQLVYKTGLVLRLSFNSPQH